MSVAGSDAFAVVGARVIAGDGSPARSGVAVVVTGGRITDVLPLANVPTGVERLTFPDGTILPGFVNLHSHMVAREGSVTSRALRAAQKAERDLRAGITTSRDLGAPDHLDVELREAIAAGLATGPDLVVACRPITRTGGHNHSFGREADGVTEVRRAVREQIKAGAGCIKLMASEGWNHTAPHRLGLSVEEMSAAVDEAHRLGVSVTVHAQGPAATKNALLAQVDCVEHGVDGITDEVIELFLKTGIALDATPSSAWAVAQWQAGPARPQALIDQAAAQVESERLGLARAVKAGMKIAGATDMHGTMPIEYRLLCEAGLDGIRALSALTSIPSAVLGRSDIGTVRRGQQADLIVIEGDPLTDQAAIGRVTAVFQRGRRLS